MAGEQLHGAAQHHLGLVLQWLARVPQALLLRQASRQQGLHQGPAPQEPAEQPPSCAGPLCWPQQVLSAGRQLPEGCLPPQPMQRLRHQAAQLGTPRAGQCVQVQLLRQLCWGALARKLETQLREA